MDFTNLILLLSVVGATLASPGTGFGKSWFNFWDTPVVGNSQSSGGPWTPGPQAGGGGQPAQGGQGGQAGAAQGISNSRPGVFSWFKNSAVDPVIGGGSSTIPPNVDLWANPDAGNVGVAQRTGYQKLQDHGHFGPNGGFVPDMGMGYHGQSSGERQHAAGPMAAPGARDPNMAGGVGQGGGNTNMAGGVGGSGGAGQSRGRGQGIHSLPLNVGNMQAGNAGRSVNSGAAAGTIVGVGLAVIVVVGVFAGAAYVLTRQRRNNHVVMANV